MSEPTVSVTMAEPMSADELWNSIMTVDDFVELLAGQPKDPFQTEHIEDLDFHANALKWGFITK